MYVVLSHSATRWVAAPTARRTSASFRWPTAGHEFPTTVGLASKDLREFPPHTFPFFIPSATCGQFWCFLTEFLKPYDLCGHALSYQEKAPWRWVMQLRRASTLLQKRLFAARHCNCCPSVWPPKCSSSYTGASAMTNAFHTKHRDGNHSSLLQADVLIPVKPGPKLQCWSYLQRSLSPSRVLKTITCEWRVILLQSVQVVLPVRKVTREIEAQESNPNLQYKGRDKKLGKVVQTFSAQGLFTLQHTKVNVHLAKLSRTVI